MAKIKLINNRGRKSSSSNWLARHLNDPYVTLARKSGYRSRAALKLLEIQEKFSLFREAQTIVDLGSAPGSWLQVAKRYASRANCIIGVDLSEVKALDGVQLVKGDFLELETSDEIIKKCGNTKISLILSDMATNASGNKVIDQLRNATLTNSVIEFAKEYLDTYGNLVIKLICGPHEANIMKQAREIFNHAILHKPKASYKDSSEIYLVAMGKL